MREKKQGCALKVCGELLVPSCPNHPPDYRHRRVILLESEGLIGRTFRRGFALAARHPLQTPHKQGAIQNQGIDSVSGDPAAASIHYQHASCGKQWGRGGIWHSNCGKASHSPPPAYRSTQTWLKAISGPIASLTLLATP